MINAPREEFSRGVFCCTGPKCVRSGRRSLVLVNLTAPRPPTHGWTPEARAPARLLYGAVRRGSAPAPRGASNPLWHMAPTVHGVRQVRGGELAVPAASGAFDQIDEHGLLQGSPRSIPAPVVFGARPCYYVRAKSNYRYGRPRGIVELLQRHSKAPFCFPGRGLHHPPGDHSGDH